MTDRRPESDDITKEAPDWRPPVIYLLGSARSGTTILDALLGDHPDIVSVGELRYVLDPEKGQPRRCACGELVGDCPFWGEVFRRWARVLNATGDHPFEVLRHTYERFYGFPRLAFDLLFRRFRFRAYRRQTASLFVSILGVSGCGFIADSSKTPARVLTLWLGNLADLRLIYIVRDPRAVVWSRIKVHERALGRRMSDFGRAVFSIRRVVQWLLVNCLSEALLPYAPQSTRIRYEDLVTDPERVLQAVGQQVGVDLAAIGAKAKAGAAFEYGHLVAGNVRRFMGPASLQMDRDWLENSPRWMKRLVWWIAWPQARLYGYRW